MGVGSAVVNLVSIGTLRKCWRCWAERRLHGCADEVREELARQVGRVGECVGVGCEDISCRLCQEGS